MELIPAFCQLMNKSMWRTHQRVWNMAHSIHARYLSPSPSQRTQKALAPLWPSAHASLICCRSGAANQFVLQVVQGCAWCFVTVFSGRDGVESVLFLPEVFGRCTVFSLDMKIQFSRCFTSLIKSVAMPFILTFTLIFA